jgi:hypothetical protein
MNDVPFYLQETDGIVVKIIYKSLEYPMPMYAEGKNEVLLSRRTVTSQYTKHVGCC